MKSEPFKQLRQLFGAYFHQDWQDDDTTAESVISRFLAGTPAEEVGATAAELRELLALGDSDEELRYKLFHDFLCYYSPPAGTAVREWLSDLEGRLSKAA